MKPIKNRFFFGTFILLFLSTITFTNCSSDDSNDDSNNNGSSNATIIGTWEFDKIGIYDAGTNIPEDFVIPFDYPHDCQANKDYAFFNEDGTGGSILYENCVEEFFPWDWSKTGNNLIIDSDGDVTNGDYNTIIRLTNNELMIKSAGSVQFELISFIKQ